MEMTGERLQEGQPVGGHGGGKNLKAGNKHRCLEREALWSPEPGGHLV